MLTMSTICAWVVLPLYEMVIMSQHHAVVYC